MIQMQDRQGNWYDCRTVDGYKTHRTVHNFADKYHRPARLVDRKGNVLYTCEEEQ